jgi:hypothetical protein
MNLHPAAHGMVGKPLAGRDAGYMRQKLRADFGRRSDPLAIRRTTRIMGRGVMKMLMLITDSNESVKQRKI